MGAQEVAHKFAFLSSFCSADTNYLRTHFESHCDNENEQSTGTTTAYENLTNLTWSTRSQPGIDTRAKSRQNKSMVLQVRMVIPLGGEGRVARQRDR